MSDSRDYRRSDGHRDSRGGGGGGGGGGGRGDHHRHRSGSSSGGSGGGHDHGDRRSSRSSSGSNAPLTAEQKEAKDAKQRERDLRTVFVQQIHPKVDDMSLLEYFSACGEVNDVKLVTDARTGRSKGLAYVEFASIDSVAIALALTGQNLAGFPITVHTTITDRRPVAKAVQAPSAVQGGSGRFSVLVSELDAALLESDVLSLFVPFGDVVTVELSHGSEVAATVVFKKRMDALSAIQGLQGFELLGRKMNVRAGFSTAAAPIELLPAVAAALAGTSAAPAAIGGMVAMPQAPLAAAYVPQQLSAAMLSGASIEAHANAAAPSVCVLLSNMYDPAQIADTDEYADIEDDARDGCGAHGSVVHVHVDRGAAGLVYVQMDSIDAATKVISAMNGRSYSKRTVGAAFIPETLFRANVPAAAALASRDEAMSS